MSAGAQERIGPPRRYTKVPRTTAWLLRESTFATGGPVGDETPPQQVHVAPFHIGKAPITNVQYEAFAPDHVRGRSSPGDDDPIVSG